MDDPYFSNPRLHRVNLDFMHYTHHVSSSNPDVFCFTGDSHALKQQLEHMSDLNI